MKDVSENVQSTYDNQYTNSDAQWRNMGGRQKAGNIMRLCGGLKAKSVVDIGSGDGAVLSFLDKAGFSDNISSLEISDSGIEKIKGAGIRGTRTY